MTCAGRETTADPGPHLARHRVRTCASGQYEFIPAPVTPQETGLYGRRNPALAPAVNDRSREAE